MLPKLSLVVNSLAFLSSVALVALSITTFVLAGEADHVFTNKFPPGEYVWGMSQWEGECRGDCKGWRVAMEYTRSNEIKTFVAAGLALFVGLQGVFAFGASFKRPSAAHLSKPVFLLALLSSLVALASAIWSAVSESQLRETTCSLNNTTAGKHFTCSIENAACTAMRMMQDSMAGEVREPFLEKGCLGSRYARFLVFYMAGVSVLLAVLYAVKVWNKGVKADDENGTDGEREGLLRI
ncbi:hypothetical protein G6514_009916 [Epicoccum nigrum]|nr:hypothetical protein G6514_009916 [Epicoccum nigrum]